MKRGARGVTVVIQRDGATRSQTLRFSVWALRLGALAGAALLAGTGGQILFFFLGLALATPMLIRLRRRFRTWAAPAIALAIFALTYTLSSLYIGPLITGEADGATEPASVTVTTDEHGH